jgi:hypothetical protein
MKKILSLVLVIALVLGSFSFAFATVATPSDVVDTDYETEVETLMALGVVNGYEDGTYKPAKVVTRAELAKLIIVELGYEDLAGGTANFSDTSGHWAEGYIALASGLGLVNGYPDGTFKPDNTVSFDEAITMVLRGLGYNDECLTGTWPTNYKIKALNIDLLDDVDVTAAGADRGNIAIMLYNMLFLAYGEVDEDGLWQENDDDDGDAKLVIDKIGDLVELYQFTYEDVYDDDDALETVTDLEPYLYHVVDYYENADGDVAYIDAVYTEEIDLDSIEAWEDEDTFYGEDDDDDEYNVDLDEIEDAMYNYASIDPEDLNSYDDYSSDGSALISGAAVTVIYADDEDLDDDDVTIDYDGNDDGNYDSYYDGEDYEDEEAVALIVTKVTYTVLVDEVDDDVIEASEGDDIDLPLDDDEDFDESRLVVMGDVDDIDDIEEDDVIEVYEPYAFDAEDEDEGGDLVLYVTRDSVTGDVDEYDGSDSVVIDGVELDYCDDYDSEVIGDSDLGDEYTAYLNADGDIAFLVLVEATATAEDFAVVADYADGTTDEDWDDIETDDAPQIKLLTADGDIVIYDVTTDDFDYDGLDDDPVELGDLELSWDGDAVGDIDISGISEGDLVIYSLDSDGDIDEILVAKYNSDDFDEDFDYDTAGGDDYDEPVLNSGYMVEDATIVFDITDEDEDEWDVIDMDQISLDDDDSVVAYVCEAGDNDVLVMTVTYNDTTSDDVYAVITDNTTAINDDDDVVQKLVGFFDGEEDIVYTDDDDVYDDEYNEYALMAVTFDDDVIDSTTVEAVDYAGDVDDVDDDFINIDADYGDDGYYEVDEEVIVYEFTFDDDGYVDEITLADMSDIGTDDYVKMWDTDNDDDGDDDEIDVIFFVPEKYTDEMDDLSWDDWDFEI